MLQQDYLMRMIMQLIQGIRKSMRRAVDEKDPEAAADMLVDIMQVLLIPSCVALMTYWRELSGSLPVLIGASVISTALVLIATGKAADAAIDMKERRGK